MPQIDHNPRLTSQELVRMTNASALPEPYFGLVPYDGRTPGFSVKAHYTDKCSFSPARYADGSPDTVMLLSFAVYPDEDRDAEGRLQTKFDISKHSLYLNDHFDYGIPGCDPDPNAPTGQSRELRDASTQPCEVRSFDYRFDPDTRLFTDENGETRNLKEVFDTQRECHLSPCYPFRGILIRLGRGIHNMKLRFWKSSQPALNYLFWLTTGMTVKNSWTPLEPYRKEDIETDVTPLTLYNISVTPNMVFAYFGAVFATLWITQPENVAYVDYLQSRVGVIVTVGAILGLLFLSTITPHLFLWAMEFCRKRLLDCLGQDSDIKKFGPLFYLKKQREVA